MDHADALIGFGASSISRFPQGYVQNEPAIAAYERMALEGGLAGVRGCAFSAQDRARAAAIERLMCRLDFDADALAAAYGDEAGPLIETAVEVVRDDRFGLVEGDGRAFRVTDVGRPFARLIAARFDAYLPKGPRGIRWRCDGVGRAIQPRAIRNRQASAPPPRMSFRHGDLGVDQGTQDRLERRAVVGADRPVLVGVPAHRTSRDLDLRARWMRPPRKRPAPANVQACRAIAGISNRSARRRGERGKRYRTTPGIRRSRM